MKLDNENIWLTGSKYEIGEILKELEMTSVYNHMQAKLYYKSGIDSIDNHFNPTDYIEKGYICTLLATLGGMTILFRKFKGENTSDIGFYHIKRSKIIGYETGQSENLKIVKEETEKHKRKNFGRKAFGGASAIISGVADEFTKVNTKKINGKTYKLLYRDENDENKTINFYSSFTEINHIKLFLNTYYKSELPEAAKTPISQKDSNCFIATACYRDMFSQEVIFFRWYRDNQLNTNIFGKFFIKIYYFISPYFYNYLFNNQKSSNKVKYILDKIYLKLK